jgi:hypothetical protein
MDHLRGYNSSSPLEIAECVTLRVRGLDANGTLSLTPATCRIEWNRVCRVGAKVTKTPLRRVDAPVRTRDATEECVITPNYHQHFWYLDRLLQSVLRYATDRVRFLVVFSRDAVGTLVDFCARFPVACAPEAAFALGLEVTDLERLTEADLSASYATYLSSLGRNAGAELYAARERAARILADVRESSSYTRPLRKNTKMMPYSAMQTRMTNLYLSALKKMLAVAYGGCRRAWVVDSESTPFRPFSFGSLIRDYWANPVVLHNGPPELPELGRDALGIHDGPMAYAWCSNSSRAFRMALVDCRAAVLDAYSARLLGQPPVLHGYYHNDWWHWDAAVMRAAFAQATATQLEAGVAPPSFVQAFARSPAHELLYYSFAERSKIGRRVHRRFVPVDTVIDDFYRRRNYSGGLAGVLSKNEAPVLDPDVCRTKSPHPFYPRPHMSTNMLLLSGVPETCGLLRALGYAGVKWFVGTPGSQDNSCFTTLKGQQKAAAAIAACHDGEEDAGGGVSWFLSSEFSATSIAELNQITMMKRPRALDARTTPVQRSIKYVRYDGDELTYTHQNTSTASFRLAATHHASGGGTRLPVRCGRAEHGAEEEPACGLKGTASGFWWWPLLEPSHAAGRRLCNQPRKRQSLTPSEAPAPPPYAPSSNSSSISQEG